MVRRVITANDAAGRSYFAADETAPEIVLWQFAPEYARLLPSTRPHIEPPPGASKCVFVQMEPWKTSRARLAGQGIADPEAEAFHRTLTTDYIIVTGGEVTLLLDEGETTLGPGDMVIQCNTNHAWQARGDIPANFWGVMVSLA